MTEPTPHVDTIRVLFFAHVRAMAGQSEVQLSCPGDVTVDGFWDRLLTAYPQLAAVRASCRVARNLEYVSGNDLIRAGDEVALVPPVSGG